MTESFYCHWFQLDVMKDHLTLKDHLCSSALTNMADCSFVDGSKKSINLSSAQLFLRSCLTSAIKIDGDTMLVQSLFCFCESAWSNGF